MVHYVRLLRAPQVSGVTKKEITVTTVATVTTDLGDAFLGDSLVLVACLVDATNSREVLQETRIPWHDGMRAVKMAITCSARLKTRLTRLHITTDETSSAVCKQVMPQVLDVWSKDFRLDLGSSIPTVVERQLVLPHRCTVRTWEETGDSIARHIWDASLGFLVLFRQIFSESTSSQLPLLRQAIAGQPTTRVRVLEVGAGCGTVGIALAQLRKSEVLLTDLDEAQNLLQSNIDCATPLAGSILQRQVLEWGASIDTLRDAKYDIVLVSDCIYNPDSSVLLVSTLRQLFIQNANLIILVGFKRRHDADDIFFERLREANLHMEESCDIFLPHMMTEYDASVPKIEFFVYAKPR